MSAPLIGGVVLILCLCSSSLGLMMSGGDDSPAPVSTPASTPAREDDDESPAPDPAPAPTSTRTSSTDSVSGYTKFDNFSINTIEEKCSSKSLNACSVQCKYDSTCSAFTHDSDEKCCLVTGVEGINYKEGNKIFVKDVIGFSVSELGDKNGSVLSTHNDLDLFECGTKCSETLNCGGISFKNGTCELKSRIGLSSTFYDNGAQFYKNISPKEAHVYEFIINVNAANESLGSHITEIRVDGRRVKSSEIQINNEPDHTKCNSKDGGYQCEGDNYGLNDPEPASPQYTDLTWTAWKRETEAVGRRMFTITTDSKVGEFEIDYFRPTYVPGWIIKENGKEVLKETANGGNANSPNPKTVKYVIPRN